jgi:hypothetical protein
MHRSTLVRHPDAQYVRMVDDISPALALGCLTVLACIVVLFAFVIVQLGGLALELVRHVPGGISP